MNKHVCTLDDKYYIHFHIYPSIRLTNRTVGTQNLAQHNDLAYSKETLFGTIDTSRVGICLSLTGTHGLGQWRDNIQQISTKTTQQRVRVALGCDSRGKCSRLVCVHYYLVLFGHTRWRSTASVATSLSLLSRSNHLLLHQSHLSTGSGETLGSTLLIRQPGVMIRLKDTTNNTAGVLCIWVMISILFGPLRLLFFRNNSLISLKNTAVLTAMTSDMSPLTIFKSYKARPVSIRMIRVIIFCLSCSNWSRSCCKILRRGPTVLFIFF